MPRATNNYPFEEKVWGGLAKLAFQLTGKSGQGCGFSAILNSQGVLTKVFCQSEYPDFRDRMKGAQAALLYDPVEGPEYQYISWSNVSADTLERILNIKFTPKDLISFSGERIDEIPSSHGVMF